MKKLAPIFTTILFLALTSSGYAQIITQTDNFSGVSVVSSTTIPLSFTPFNLSLGTLNSVDYSLTGTLNISGYVTRTNSYNITFNLPYRLEGGSSPQSQLDAETISSNISGASVSAGTTIPDNYNVSIQVDNLSKTITPSSLYFPSGLLKTQTTNTYSIGSATFTGHVTLTYNYAVAPEPSTWALLLAGLGLLAFFRFRARRA